MQKRLKCANGCALGSIVGKDESVEDVPSAVVVHRVAAAPDVVRGEEPRYTEPAQPGQRRDFTVTGNSFVSRALNIILRRGFVLTGGAAQIEGLAACAQRVFHTQVRNWCAAEYHRFNGLCSGAVLFNGCGLLHYGKESHLSGEAEVEKPSQWGRGSND